MKHIAIISHIITFFLVASAALGDIVMSKDAAGVNSAQVATPGSVVRPADCGLERVSASDDWDVCVSKYELWASCAVVSCSRTLPNGDVEQSNFYPWFDSISNPCHVETFYYRLASTSVDGNAFAFSLSRLNAISGLVGCIVVKPGTRVQMFDPAGNLALTHSGASQLIVANTGARDAGIIAGGCQTVNPAAILLPGHAYADLGKYSVYFGISPAFVSGLSTVPSDRAADWIIPTESILPYRLHNDSRYILRRSSTADFYARVTTNFQPCHEIVAEISHSFNGVSQSFLAIPFQNPPYPSDQWGVRLVTTTELSNIDDLIVYHLYLSLKLVIPSNAAVGEYSVALLIREKDTERVVARVAMPRTLTVLFNATSPSDPVFFPGVVDRGFYLFREGGWIYKHQSNPPTAETSTPWNFGQFDRDTLLVTLRLLDGLGLEGRRDPALVSRWLSRKLNANGMNASIDGVLVGKWRPVLTAQDADLIYGRRRWLGSTAIFSRYVQNQYRTVRAGQCWNFGGILTSSLRSLGIASRPVTCWGSSQDNDRDGLLTWRWRFADESDPQGTRIVRDQAAQVDSVWNFHVWTEAFFARGDRPGYAGWQAVDATPEITGATGFFECGPAPLGAVLADVGGNYDVDWVRSQVVMPIVNICKRRGSNQTFVIDATTPRLIVQVPSGSRVNTVVTEPRQPASVVGGIPGVKDITSNYFNPLIAPPVLNIAPNTTSLASSVALSDSVNGALGLVNSDPVDREYVYSVTAVPCDTNGADAGIAPVDLSGRVLVPANSSLSVAMGVDNPTVRAWFLAADHVRWHLGVWCPATDVADVGIHTTQLTPPAVVVTSSNSGICRPTGWLLISASAVAPINASSVSVVWTSPDGSVFSSGQNEIEVPLGGVTAGQTISVFQWLRGAFPVEGAMVTAAITFDNFPSSVGATSISVSGCAADFDMSGGVGTTDVFEYLNMWFVESSLPCQLGLSTDVDGDGCATTADLFQFLNSYFSGC